MAYMDALSSAKVVAETSVRRTRSRLRKRLAFAAIEALLSPVPEVSKYSSKDGA